MIKNKKGYELTYCDQEGNEYRQSTDFQDAAVKLFYKYNPYNIQVIEQSYEQQKKSLENQFNKNKQAYEKATADYRSRNLNYEDYFASYNQYKSSFDTFYDFQKQKNNYIYQQIIKDSNFTNIEKILSDLTTINPDHILSGEKVRLKKFLENNRLLSMCIEGTGDTSAVSLYRSNGKKLGELSAKSGFFKRAEDAEQGSFFFNDGLKNLYTRYDGTAFLGVTKAADENYQADFIEGVQRSGDLYFNRRHFNGNDLLRPDVSIIDPEQLSAVVMNEATPIHRRQDSPAAHYTEQQRRNGISVDKGELLDDRGSEDPTDNVYGAVLKEKGQAVYSFKNIGFYISEKMGNGHSSFFIHDHGSNKRFQLPEAITHLKLIEINRQFKLVPCDQNGNEHPEGMPKDIGNYRYIDPIFAHTYAKRDYSTQHTNEGPIDFSQYLSGQLFSIKHDPNEAAIKREAAGNLRPDQAYFTKVKLFNGDQEVGMLSNDFSNFKGAIFLSVDYNYSYSDFLASVSPTVHIEKLPDGRTKITFGQSAGDVGGTDRGYTDHQRYYSAKATDTVAQKLASTLSADTTNEQPGNPVQGSTSDNPFIPKPALTAYSRGRA